MADYDGPPIIASVWSGKTKDGHYMANIKFVDGFEANPDKRYFMLKAKSRKDDKAPHFRIFEGDAPNKRDEGSSGGYNKGRQGNKSYPNSGSKQGNNSAPTQVKDNVDDNIPVDDDTPF
jgi:hypothetical protein